MISLFRNFAKSKWAIGLLVLVALGLLFTGGSQMDVLGSLEPPKVVTAGDRGMTPQEFRAAMDRQLEQIQAQQGRAVTYEELLSQVSLGPLLRARAQELGFFAWAWKVGIRPGEELVLRQIRTIPAFFDPVTNQFSEDLYKSRLAEAKMTPASFKQEARDEYIRAHYGLGLMAGLRMPHIYGAVYANQTQQTRDGRWFILTQQMAGTAPQPTDAQLTEHMNRNAANLRRPEFRTGSVIAFDSEADRNVAISDEQIQARFNFRKDSLSLPERRTFTTLTAPSRAAAERIAGALRAGQTVAAVAEANDLQPAEYADTARSAISDPAVGAAVFGLNVDEVSAPVQARVGFVVAKLGGITPGREVTLADVRDQIVGELQGQEARAAIARRVEAFEAAQREGKNLEEAIRTSGARIVPIPAVTRDGRGADGQPLQVPEAIRDAMWKLAEGRASEVMAAGPGQYIVVRVDDIVPAAMPTLQEVRERLAQDWIARENMRLLSARSDALLARLRAGEDIAAVAASVGATVNSRTGVRQEQAAVQQLGEGVVVGLFSAGRGQPFAQAQAPVGMAIGRVDRITAPTAALAAEEARQWQARLAGATSEPLFAAAGTAAADRMKAKYDEDLARQALGVTTPAATPAPAQPAGR